MANEARVAEVAQTVADTAAEIADTTATQTQIEAVIENAEERVEIAQEATQAIADAALLTELGRTVSEFTRDFGSWREEINGLQISDRLSKMEADIRTLMEKMTAPPAQPMIIETPAAPPLSSPAILPTAEPGVLADARNVQIAENLVDLEAPKRRVRFL